MTRHVPPLGSRHVWLHMMSSLRYSEIRNYFPSHILLKVHLYPNLYHAGLGQPSHGSQFWWLFEKWDVRRPDTQKSSPFPKITQKSKVPLGSGTEPRVLLLDAPRPRLVLHWLLNRKMWELEWTLMALSLQDTDQPNGFQICHWNLDWLRSSVGSLFTASTNPWVVSSVSAPDLLLDWAASFQAQIGQEPPQSSSFHFCRRTMSVGRGLLTAPYSLHVHVSFCFSHHALPVAGDPPGILEEINGFLKNIAKTSAFWPSWSNSNQIYPPT